MDRFYPRDVPNSRPVVLESDVVGLVLWALLVGAMVLAFKGWH